MGIKVILHDGEMLPKWYGVAYYDVMRASVVSYPIGVHWLVGWFRNLVWLIRGPVESLQVEFERAEFQKELARAWTKGFRAGVLAAHEAHAYHPKLASAAAHIKEAASRNPFRA